MYQMNGLSSYSVNEIDERNLAVCIIELGVIGISCLSEQFD